MCKKLQHIIVLTVLLLSFTRAMAQIAMPDTVCVGTARVYQVNDASIPSTYTWKIDGVTQASIKNAISINWNTAGTFLLSVKEHSAGGCDGDMRTGLVYVMAPPLANAGSDTVVCFGSSVRLNGSGGAFYQWTPSTYLSNAGIKNPTIISAPQGILTYLLNVTNSNGCKSLKSDTVVITILPPLKIFAGNDTAVSINQPLQLNAADVNNSGLNNYLWSPSSGLNNSGIKNPVALFSSPTGINGITYTVTARTINGCEATDDITVKVFVQADIYVPSAFSPNNDGLNDIFKPILIGIKELKYFAVYNRYGQQVYKTTVQGAGWDGKVKGIRQNTGAFVWMAEAVDYKGNILMRKGSAVLIK